MTTEATPHIDVARARGMGVSMALLEAAKAAGWDWCVTSSWCSGQDVFIARVRAPGMPAHSAATKVGALCEVLHWAAGRCP